MFTLFWDQFKALLDAGAPMAAQVALFYLILRFAFAVTGLLLDLAASAAPRPLPANGPPNSLQQPQLPGNQARPGIPERASS